MACFVITAARAIARGNLARILLVLLALGIGAALVAMSSDRYAAKVHEGEVQQAQEREDDQIRLRHRREEVIRERLARRDTVREAKRRLREDTVDVTAPIPRDVLRRYTDVESYRLPKTPDLAIDNVVVRRSLFAPSGDQRHTTKAAQEEMRLEVLLCHRKDNHRLATPGGFVEYGEAPEEATLRELREETGLDLADWLQGDAAAGAARPMRTGPVRFPPEELRRAAAGLLTPAPEHNVSAADILPVDAPHEDGPGHGTNLDRGGDVGARAAANGNALPGAQLLGIYGDPFRDRRRHTVSVAYLFDLRLAPRALGAQKPQAGDDAKTCSYFPLVDTVRRWRNRKATLAFDHGLILEDALAALRRVARVWK